MGMGEIDVIVPTTLKPSTGHEPAQKLNSNPLEEKESKSGGSTKKFPPSGEGIAVFVESSNVTKKSIK